MKEQFHQTESLIFVWDKIKNQIHIKLQRGLFPPLNFLHLTFSRTYGSNLSTIIKVMWGNSLQVIGCREIFICNHEILFFRMRVFLYHTISHIVLYFYLVVDFLIMFVAKSPHHGIRQMNNVEPKAVTISLAQLQGWEFKVNWYYMYFFLQSNSITNIWINYFKL